MKVFQKSFVHSVMSSYPNQTLIKAIHHNKINADIKSEEIIKEEEIEEPEIFTEAVEIPPIILQPLPPKYESDTPEAYDEALSDNDESDGEDDYDGENYSQGEGDKAGKTKRKPRHLLIHMLSHTKEKCQYCERSFSTKGNLATHTPTTI
jgi:hypothetical protein